MVLDLCLVAETETISPLYNQSDRASEIEISSEYTTSLRNMCFVEETVKLVVWRPFTGFEGSAGVKKPLPGTWIIRNKQYRLVYLAWPGSGIT